MEETKQANRDSRFADVVYSWEPVDSLFRKVFFPEPSGSTETEEKEAKG